MKTAPHKRGFTLIEILVVITIIAILSVIGLTAYSGVSARARDAQRQEHARQLVIAIEQYKSGAGKYPIQDPNWANSGQATNPWLSSLDVSSFREGKLPVDPNNSGSYLYYYKSNATGADYCLEIPQEQNACGHKYTFPATCATAAPWKLHFGPKKSNEGVCADAAVLPSS